MRLPPHGQYGPIQDTDGHRFPSHWKIRRLRFIVDVNPVRSAIKEPRDDLLVSFLPMEAIGERGEIDVTAERCLADVRVGYTYFEEGDVLVAKITPCFENGKGAIARNLCNGIGFGTTELHVLRASEAAESSWLLYLTQSGWFRDWGGASMYGAGGQKRVPEDFIKNIRVGIPDLHEQQEIAAFLNFHIGTIDQLNLRNSILLERLSEWRRTIISSWVFGGLNPSRDFSEPGDYWYGVVPSSWLTMRTKFIALVGNGSTPSREDSNYWNGGTYPWLNSSVVNQETVTEADQFVTPLALAECHLPRIKPPAVLVGITGQGKTRGMATMLVFEATINQHIAYVKPDESQIDVRYLRRVFDAAYAYLRRESDGGGSTKGAITCEQIANLPIPVPPMDEQLRIVDAIENEVQRIDAMAATVQRAIERLQEYRTALITAAVTGQIDVRQAIPEPAAT